MGLFLEIVFSRKYFNIVLLYTPAVVPAQAGIQGSVNDTVIE